MTIVLCIGLFVELLFIIRLEYKVCANESGIFGIDGRVDRLTHDIKGSEEAIKVLSDSVRKVNGVVKDLEQKPKTESENSIDTRAFIAGWDADEPEQTQQLISKEELMMQLVKANLNCQRRTVKSMKTLEEAVERFSGCCLFITNQKETCEQLAEWLSILKKAKFEYDEAWRILTQPTPDVTYADRDRAQVILDTFKDSLGRLEG